MWKSMRLARLEPDLPDPHLIVLEQDLLADFAELDAAIGRGLQSEFVVHGSCPILPAERR